jgi:hypothetical protein
MRDDLRGYATIGLLGLCLAALMANILLTWQVHSDLRDDRSCRPPAEAPACRAVPVSFVHDYPECANRLLQAMNISNVRIVSASDAAAAVGP